MSQLECASYATRADIEPARTEHMFPILLCVQVVRTADRQVNKSNLAALQTLHPC